MKIKFDVFASLKHQFGWIVSILGMQCATISLWYGRKVDMSTYQELLLSKPSINGKECGLGKILATEGRQKHDEILNAIFTINPDTGGLYSDRRLAILFADEYGWSEFFFRRHKNGKCVSCLKRT